MNDQARGTVGQSGETALERYYRFHAPVYDLTRWTFLFGRSGILRKVAAKGSPCRILEVGCGTGRNLAELGRLFPSARITGLDRSLDMLERAKKRINPMGGRIELVRQGYNGPIFPSSNFDLVLFSYSLTMFNPGFEVAIEAASRELAPDGRVAVVDFHDSTCPGFERWMGLNHVRVNGQLRPILREHFAPLHDELRQAYGGIWRYLLFLGRKS